MGLVGENFTDQAVIDRLTGEAGTPVVLTIERDGQELEITGVRDAIKVQAVRGLHRDTASEDAPWLYLLDPQRNIAYIRLPQFTPGVAGEVAQALEAARVIRSDGVDVLVVATSACTMSAATGDARRACTA